jgi:hypothetical protein
VSLVTKTSTPGQLWSLLMDVISSIFIRWMIAGNDVFKLFLIKRESICWR